MLNKNFVMLSILFAAVVGFTLTTAVAVEKTTYTTGKLYFKKPSDSNCFYTEFPDVKIDNRGNIIQGWYNFPGGPDGNRLLIRSIKYGNWEIMPKDFEYKVTKAVVEFRKTVNGKTQTSTKTFQSGTEGFKTLAYGNTEVYYNPKNNYRPYSAVVSYQKK